MSNQRGVYEEKLTLVQYEEMTELLCKEIEISRSQIFECFHRPNPSNCFCRKPKPGLLFMAKGVYDIDLENSWLVGDSVTDIQTAYAAGVSNALFIRRPAIEGSQIGNKEEEEKLIQLAARNSPPYKPKVINGLSEIISLDLLKRMLYPVNIS